MKKIFQTTILGLLIIITGFVSDEKQSNTVTDGKIIVLFDGNNLDMWEGDSSVWRIEGDAVTAGNIEIEQPENNFLATKKDYKNYILKLQFKLEGTKGFINSGIQLHSQRNKVAPFYEMVGFQADLGNGLWGSLYDESRRNIILAKADQAAVGKVLRNGGWNDYEIRCKERRITIFLNGLQTIDYTEPRNDFPDAGKIALQIHGEGSSKISFRKITLEEF